MLDANLKSQLQAHLQRITRPVELVASLDEGEPSRELRALLEEVASLHPQLSLRVERGAGERTPSFVRLRFECAGCRLRTLHVEKPSHIPCDGRDIDDPVATDRCQPLRTDLRGRAEERGPCGPGDRDRSR